MTKVLNNSDIIEKSKSILEDYKFSMYSNMFDKIKLKDITLDEFLHLCSKPNDILTQINEIRNCIDAVKKQELKLKLPCVTISGKFANAHIAKGLQLHSNLLQLDIDKIENVQAVFEKLKHDKYIMCLMISPTGTGIKGIIKINGAKHKESFLSLETYMLSNYSITIDNKCKDVSRLMFFTHDTEMYINAKSEELPFFANTLGANKLPGSKPKNNINPNNSHPQNIAECWSFTEQSKSYSEGNRNDYIFQYACNANRAGLNQIEVLQFALDNCSDINEAEIKATVKSAYKNTTDFGTKAYKSFYAVKPKATITPVNEEKHSNSIPIEENGIKQLTEKEILISNLYRRINDSEGKLKDISLQYNGMINFMYYLGYRRFDIGNEYIVVKIKYNVLNEETPHLIQQNVFRFIDTLPEILVKDVPKEMLFEKLRKSRDKLFNKGFFSMLLPDKEYIFNTDTHNECFIYYQNGYVKVTANNVEFLEYKNLTAYIWEKQILKRDFVAIDDNEKRDFVFSKYLNNISNNDDTRLLSLHTLIGYLLHNYFDTQLKAVVFTDSSITDEPNGRTGKTLLGKALLQIKPTTIINGKTFIPDSQFRYQEVSYETQIVFLNDLKPNFQVETLFNDITEGIKIERKNQAPVSKYAKMLVATNRTLKIVNASARGRFIEYEFSEYYNDKFSPFSEFKKMFFGTGFTTNDWNEFDNIICECIREYLDSGIIEAPVINLHRRKAIEETNQDFVSWFECLINEGYIKNMYEYDKTELHEKFMLNYPDARNNKYLNQQKTFTKFLHSYCSYSEKISIFQERKSSDKRYVSFCITENIE